MFWSKAICLEITAKERNKCIVLNAEWSLPTARNAAHCAEQRSTIQKSFESWKILPILKISKEKKSSAIKD